MAFEVGNSLLEASHKTFEQANQSEMVNRFFETTVIQKTIPKLFGKTFTILLQSLTGLILIAFYHPFFLIFTLGIPLAIFLIWKFFSPKALKHSFLESRRKYDLAGWLEDIARNHLIFKSRQGNNYAKFKIDFLTGLYLKERKLHFKNLFSQVIFLYVLYAFTTALLLVLGGWLVLKNQLSLGQLVASELVISAIIYNIANLGRDFESFYDLAAASEKISQFQNIPSEKTHGEILQNQIREIRFDEVYYRFFDNEYRFNFTFLQDKNYAIFTNGYSTKKVITEMLFAFISPTSGRLLINGGDVNNLDKYDLRSRIGIIDNSPLIEGTLREYLTFNREDIPDSLTMTVLENLGIAQLIIDLKEGLDLRIIPSGWPFLESEKILLKVARILLQEFEIIIADEILDMLNPELRKKILYHLTKERQASFLYFSHRLDGLDDFDYKLQIEKLSSIETKI